MDRSESCDPYRCPARRTQWIVSALAYHYGLDRGVENEIIVLATGLDQYLQEIFHHLDCEGEGRIPGEDFQTLCEILGLDGTSEAEECAGILEQLPKELSFRQFHAKLCGHFSTRAGCQYETGRLLVGKESEHIETQIRLRSPLRRRKKTICGGQSAPSLSGSEDKRQRASSLDRQQRRGLSWRQHDSCSKECYEDIVALEEAEDKIAKLELENESLRELVEDMRAALQSSDARSLALQVGLWKSHARHESQDCFLAWTRSATYRNLRSSANQNQGLQSVLKEIELIRSSRDGQIEEAIRFNQEMESELSRSQDALLKLEECNRNLKQEQLQMRKRVEEARQALLGSLEKVKELETRAKQVPFLQRSVAQLESELQYYRSEVRKFQFPQPSTQERRPPLALYEWKGGLPAHQERRSPTGDTETSAYNIEEQLFRSVEGQAASDEEDEKWTEDQKSQVKEVKKLLTSLCCCGNGCDDKTIRKLLSEFGNIRSDESNSAVLELVEKVAKLKEQLELKEYKTQQMETNMHQLKGSLLCELQQKVDETELLQMELQMLETERVRLSLIEEKLMDVLQLLQQLRDLNVSRRSLGKILLSTLESCNNPQHGKVHILEVLNALYHELAACELLSGKPLEKAQSHQSLVNPLLISC
ncbi:EF-hand and coiled-coil domain-containing protein 1 isoform X1 [Carcharodon carcharias]|uniref:EF-hand and coiled-coil domain-containing protein 1 isoform X1 n=1 Tax=Carcharodon carcharias TaxID=13397 RepID=UPI001B7E0557|nr:EF-hand and coiled-coil domain-containing protein 1 isoform X1 [Carcharodon carcharias]